MPGVASEWTARAVEHHKTGIPYPGLSLEMCPYQRSVPGTWMAAAVEEAMAAIQAAVVIVDTQATVVPVDTLMVVA